MLLSNIHLAILKTEQVHFVPNCDQSIDFLLIISNIAKHKDWEI